MTPDTRPDPLAALREAPPEDGTGITHERCGFLLACPCWTAGAAAARQPGEGLDVERLARWLYARHAKDSRSALPFSRWPDRWEDSSYWEANPDKREAVVEYWTGLAEEALEYAR